MTKQTGEEGSSRSLILSLMVDHCHFLHPVQLARIENKLPAYTVGSLMGKIKAEALLDTFEKVILSDKPMECFKQLAKSLEDNVVFLHISKKHMVSRKLGRLEASSSLRYRRTA